jgi:hypothetical protein
VVLSVELYEAGKIRPKEGTVCENAAPYDGIAAIPMLADQTIGNRFRIVLEIDAVRPRHAKIVMVDQCVVAEAHLAGNGFHQRDEFVPRSYPTQGFNDGVAQCQAE